jgi:uncharacterized membrane protein HdeD (DUF308 family)
MPKEAYVMKMRSVVPMRIAKIGYIIISVAFCLAGLLLIMLPNPSITVIGNFCGIAMMTFGIIKLVGYFSKDLYRLAFQYDFQFGILLFVLGAIVMLKPNNVINFLCISLGISILADGLFKIQIAIDARKFGIEAWWLIFTLAFIAGIIGLVLIFRPAESTRVLLILFGVALLAEGLLNLCVAISTVKIIKNQMPDVIESNDFEM